jgi:hypothetical protein
MFLDYPTCLLGVQNGQRDHVTRFRALLLKCIQTTILERYSRTLHSPPQFAHTKVEALMAN